MPATIATTRFINDFTMTNLHAHGASAPAIES
jgi:hypothetical protein